MKFRLARGGVGDWLSGMALGAGLGGTMILPYLLRYLEWHDKVDTRLDFFFFDLLKECDLDNNLSGGTSLGAGPGSPP